MTIEASIVARMTASLAHAGIDLSDEREVIRWLSAKGFAQGDIVAYADKAAKFARKSN